MLIFIKVLSYFLCARTKLVFFHISGNIPFSNDSSNQIFKGMVPDSLQIFIILIDTLSCPCHLLEFNYIIIIDNISLFVTRKALILVFVLNERGGNTQPFFMGVHIEAKMLLKILAFLQ